MYIYIRRRRSREIDIDELGEHRSFGTRGGGRSSSKPELLTIHGIPVVLLAREQSQAYLNLPVYKKGFYLGYRNPMVWNLDPGGRGNGCGTQLRHPFARVAREEAW